MHKQVWELDADNFINNETPFHLGFLVTESSHPYTKKLSKTIQDNTANGISQLLSVDSDISKTFSKCHNNPELQNLKGKITKSVLEENRIIFSGCGSTGRLAVLLESMWRKGCLRLADKLDKTEENSKLGELLKKSASNVRGIITGGDRALIKSVENFEDYQEFGRQQVRELNLNSGDIFIAISEGGETSSVIGTAHEALKNECNTFFIFNNPSDLLCKNIERSRILIENPKVSSIDLTTGPMSISGSTRMQATSMELLTIGSILELVLINILQKTNLKDNYTLKTLKDYSTAFNSLLHSLQDNQSTNILASLVELEEQVYTKKEMIIYTINDFLLDIFTDTTERTPTFSTPALKSTFAKNDPSPWAAALQPQMDTRETWMEMIGREPVGLDWDSKLYNILGSPELEKNPPLLGKEEIYSYKIGSEGFEVYNNNKLTHIEIVILDATSRKSKIEEQNFCSSKLRLIISDSNSNSTYLDKNTLELKIPDTPLRLFTHIAAKLVFNTISTGTMARLGRIQGNWMVEVTPSNKKLIDRSIRIISDLKSISYREASYMVFKEIYKNPNDLSSLVARLL